MMEVGESQNLFKMKINFLFSVFFIIFVITVLFFSCAKEESKFDDKLVLRSATQVNNQVRFTREENSNEPFMILGSSFENPFKLSNINTAKMRLYGSGIPNMTATHRYVKFAPATQGHLALLEDWETDNLVAVFDFPMDRVIITGGEKYIDPNVQDTIFTYRYSYVPVGVTMPDVPSEMIYELYLDRSDPLLVAESFWLTYNEEDINEYVFRGGLTSEDLEDYDDEIIEFRDPPDGEEDECPPGYEWRFVLVDPGEGRGEKPQYEWQCVPIIIYSDPPTNACGCSNLPSSRNPGGCVRVQQDEFIVPVQRAKIITWDKWFVSDITYTDDNGCWRINKEYSKRMWMWVRFKNENVKVRDTRYWACTKSVQDYVGVIIGPPYNNIYVEYSAAEDDIRSFMRKCWAAAHSLNVVNQYRNRAATDQIPLTRTGLNWINSINGGGGAAPMLQGNLFNSWLAFLAAFRFPIEYPLTVFFLPDIVNTYGTREVRDIFGNITEVPREAVRLRRTGFHELGHASHYAIVGEPYWRKYRNHIINNFGYGSFGNFSSLGSYPGIVALGEALGHFIEAAYGDNAQAGGEGIDFNIPNDENPENFIPRGLWWDLIDPISFTDIITNPNDESIWGHDSIEGFTIQMLFNALSPEVTDIRQFRDRLRELHLQSTPNNETDYNNFLDLYDVFNN
jgi:hypothetical protein